MPKKLYQSYNQHEIPDDLLDLHRFDVKRTRNWSGINIFILCHITGHASEDQTASDATVALQLPRLMENGF